MPLNVTHRLELQKLLFLDANAETGVRFNQDFVKPQRVDPDVFHEAGIKSDHRWIGAGNAMQDLDEASLQLLLVGGSLAQHRHSFDPAKVPVMLRLSLAPVPAELLVDGLVINVDEEAQAILRQA